MIPSFNGLSLKFIIEKYVHDNTVSYKVECSTVHAEVQLKVLE